MWKLSSNPFWSQRDQKEIEEGVFTRETPGHSDKLKSLAKTDSNFLPQVYSTGVILSVFFFFFNPVKKSASLLESGCFVEWIKGV